MLRVITVLLTLFVCRKVQTSRNEDDAIGYLLLSPLLTIPLIFTGNSGSAAVYAFDLVLLLYVMRFSGPILENIQDVFHTLPGAGALLFICILAVISTAVNWAFVEPTAWKYYLFCGFKYFEFLVTALLVGSVSINARSLKKMKVPIIWWVSVYGFLLLLHLLSIVKLGGQQYFVGSGDSSSLWAGKDVQSWFLAGFKAQVGSNASVGVFLALMVLPVVESRFRKYIFVLVLLLVGDVFLTTSRSDLVGIVGGLLVFGLLMLLSRNRWKAIAVQGTVAGLCVVILVGAMAWSRWDEKSRERISELWNSEARATGSYKDRSHDAKALPAYMIKFPLEAFVGAGPGNYFRYPKINVTIVGLGHNAYRSILGELGWAGLFALLLWCARVGFDAGRSLKSAHDTTLWAALTIGLLVDRMLASWSADSLLSPMNMGGANLMAVGAFYMLLRLKRYGVRVDKEIEAQMLPARIIN